MIDTIGGGGIEIYPCLNKRYIPTYISFLDSDDYLDLMAFEKLLEKAIDSKADITRGRSTTINSINFFCHHSIANFNGSVDTKFYLQNIDISYFVFNATNCLVKTEIFKKGLRYPESVINEDMQFGFDLLLYTKKIYFYNKITYYHRLRKYSASHYTSFMQKYSKELLYQTFEKQIVYLNLLIKKYPWLTTLATRTRTHAASTLMINVLTKDISEKDNLKQYLHYCHFKAKICYFFPKFYKFLRSIKLIFY